MLLLIVNSCKKDGLQQLPIDNAGELKTWYQFNHLDNSTNFLANLTPNWNTAYQENQDGVFVIELDVDKPKSIAMMSGIADQNKLSSLASRTHTRLVLLKNLNTGNMDGCLMVISGTSTTDLTKLHYKNFTSLTGSVMYFDLQGNFVNGYKYTQGKIIANLTKALSQNYNEMLLANNSSSAAPLGIGNNKLMVVDVASCNTEPVDIYVERCGSVSAGPISNPTYNPESSKPNEGKLMSSSGGNGCIMVYSETVYQTDCPYTDPFEGGGGGYGGSGGGNDDPASITKEINNNLTDPCLKTTVTEALASNKDVKGFLGDVINKYANLNNGIVINLSNGNIPKTAQTTSSLTNNTFTANIVFQNGYYNDVSKEAVVAALIHEVVHAYLLQTNNTYKNQPEAAQHNFLFTNFVHDIGDYLINKYNMPSDDAYGLAWSGMGDIYNKAGENDTFITAPAIPATATSAAVPAKTMTKTQLGGAVDPYKRIDLNPKGTPNCP